MSLGWTVSEAKTLGIENDVLTPLVAIFLVLSQPDAPRLLLGLVGLGRGLNALLDSLEDFLDVCDRGVVNHIASLVAVVFLFAHCVFIVVDCQ